MTRCPALPAGVVVGPTSSLSLLDGELLARVTLRGAVSTLDDEAMLLSTGPRAATLLLRKGAPFAGSTIRFFSVLQPAIASEGQGRWHTEAGVTAKLTLTDGRAFVVVLAHDGTATIVLRAGEPGPSLGGAKIAASAFRRSRAICSRSRASSPSRRPDRRCRSGG